MRLIVCGGMLPFGWTCEVMKYVHPKGSIFYDILCCRAGKLKSVNLIRRKREECDIFENEALKR